MAPKTKVHRVFRFGEKGATGGVILFAITLTLTATLAAIARRPAPVKPAHFEMSILQRSLQP